MDADALLELTFRQVEHQALILLDARGSVVAWMMGAATIFGYPAEDMVGRTLHCLFTPEDQAAHVPENELTNARGSGTGEDDR
jgi:two-component system CheB/CheR fusion protein